MRAVYNSGSVFIIKVEDDLYYYGDGANINAFGQNAVQFLRYNPYLKDVSEKRIAIPETITETIKRHLEAREK